MTRPSPLPLPAMPSRVADLPAWSTRHGFSRDAARRRYAQAAIAAGIALTPSLRQSLVFKGGNALDFALSVNRSTIDLDFSFAQNSDSMGANAEEIERHLSAGCERAALRRDISLAVHRVRQHPPGTGRTFITFETRIGYALSDELALRERMAQGRPSPNSSRSRSASTSRSAPNRPSPRVTGSHRCESRASRTLSPRSCVLCSSRSLATASARRSARHRGHPPWCTA